MSYDCACDLANVGCVVGRFVGGFHLAPRAKNDKIYLSYKQNGIDRRFQRDSIHSEAMVVERTYDIVCDTHVPVKEFSLYGTGVLSLCSLYISGGMKEQVLSWISSRAVNGKLDIPDNETSPTETCSQTKRRCPVWWRLTFLQRVDVFMFRIYNRIDRKKTFLVV
ncbi:hypothetical protein RRG08_035513 [Elysia crispata]|uniref:Uncharacterized protein n=1 Tax=Elysia crispata TaxID=231223 RepID=A0AAE1A4Q2_9GAST|nr:hypothetical protein RRG08_035513 [Elysia crispata]